ncbi:hypothetical protein PtB15_4B518 [Puccinia triticina]|nr:hypothetical protein PtB15_4B518 [Puccinia triticina]
MSQSAPPPASLPSLIINAASKLASEKLGANHIKETTSILSKYFALTKTLW